MVVFPENLLTLFVFINNATNFESVFNNCMTVMFKFAHSDIITKTNFYGSALYSYIPIRGNVVHELLFQWRCFAENRDTSANKRRFGTVGTDIYQ